jgi:glycosyltransferase involved in cell wall biosynthesis
MTTDRYTRKKVPNVVHVVPSLFGDDRGIVGGAERYAFELARFMARRVPTQLVSFGKRPEQWKEQELDVRVLGHSHYVRSQPANPISSELPKALRGADVVHVHQQHIVASTVSAALARLRGQRVFVSDLGGGGWDISGYVSTDRWYHGHLHISSYSRRICGQEANPRSHVIFGGVDTEKFTPDTTVERTGSVLFVGRLLAHKGIDVLIDSIDDGLRLEVIGRPYDEAYLRLLKERAAGKNVTFRHDANDDDLVAAFRRSACIVLPSVYRDVFGNITNVPELLGQTLLEGMACGIPAVCSNVASMPEVVIDGLTGFVVPPNDSESLRARLHVLVDEVAQREAMGNAARLHVLERFTWPAVVDRCLNIYAGKDTGGAS